jgi:hypothetical protein
VRDGAGELRGIGTPPVTVGFHTLRGAIGADGIGADAAGRPFGSAVTLDLEVSPVVAGATLGPWPAMFRRTGGQEVIQVDLKPAAPGTAFVRREARADGAKLQVRIKNARFDELKLAPIALVPHDAMIDVEIDQDEVGEKGYGQAKLIASRFVVPGAPADAPLSLSVAYDLATNVARVREGTFGFGPFHGSVTGEVDRSTLPHAKLELTSTRTACTALAGSAAEQAFPGLGAMVVSMAGDVLRGDLGFVANVDLDLANPSAVRMGVRPVGACSIDIPLFPKGLLPPK